MNKIEQEKYVEMMEMKTNKASQDIIRMIKDQGLDPQAAIVSILKASAIINYICKRNETCCFRCSLSFDHMDFGDG